MLRDAIIPLLTERFPGKFVVSDPGKDPCVTFPAIHPDVGDIGIYDDGDELTLFLGRFTHCHFSNYEEIPMSEKEAAIAKDVIAFLEKLFADQVVMSSGFGGRIGGTRIIGPESTKHSLFFKEYVWSGPRFREYASDTPQLLRTIYWALWFIIIVAIAYGLGVELFGFPLFGPIRTQGHMSPEGMIASRVALSATVMFAPVAASVWFSSPPLRRFTIAAFAAEVFYVALPRF